MDVVIETDFDDPVPIYKLALSLFPCFDFKFCAFVLFKKEGCRHLLSPYIKKKVITRATFTISTKLLFFFDRLRQQQQQYLNLLIVSFSLLLLVGNFLFLLLPKSISFHVFDSA